jgi:hypothetical protein
MKKQPNNSDTANSAIMSRFPAGKHDAYASVWHTMIDALGGYGRPPKQEK